MTTVTQQIKHRWSGNVLFECEVDAALHPSRRLGEAVKLAMAARVNLFGANLFDANLTGANLTRADLTGANLTCATANLTCATLRGANLRGANLRGADLTHADLADANLTGANLAYANLAGANLTHAKLAGANFSQADLAGANLDGNCIIDGGLRSDGWRIFLWWDESRGWRIRAGCRDFTLAEAREHGTATRGGTTLGAESLAILDHLERLAAIRGWDLSEQPAKSAESEGQ